MFSTHLIKLILKYIRIENEFNKMIFVVTSEARRDRVEIRRAMLQSVPCQHQVHRKYEQTRQDNLGAAKGKDVASMHKDKSRLLAVLLSL